VRQQALLEVRQQVLLEVRQQVLLEVRQQVLLEVRQLEEQEVVVQQKSVQLLHLLREAVALLVLHHQEVLLEFNKSAKNL
jgi:hypothetical protein